jgi:hypothetical protein
MSTKRMRGCRFRLSQWIGKRKNGCVQAVMLQVPIHSVHFLERQRQLNGQADRFEVD